MANGRPTLKESFARVMSSGTIHPDTADFFVSYITTEPDVWALASLGDEGYRVIHRLKNQSGTPRVQAYAAELLEPQAPPLHVQKRELARKF